MFLVVIFIDLLIIIKMSSIAKVKNNKQQDTFNNLLTEIILYLDSKDNESLEYLLEGESQQKLSQIRSNLKAKYLNYFDDIVSKLKAKYQEESSYQKHQQPVRVKAMLKKQQQQSQEEYENIEKEFKLTDIIYGENYSYPYLSLLQKMSLIYFYKNHPNPFPQNCLKMLHSLIQTLFTFVFDLKIKENYLIKCQKHKKSFNNFLKEYLFFVFEKQYQKFTTFHKLFKSIKNSISKKQQITQEDVNLEKSNSHHHPLTQTHNLEELEYFESISAEIKSEVKFKEFTKIKCLNFLYFGQKRLKQLIDPSGKFLAENIQKQVIQLISFILCRFVRKVILNCIRKKMNGKLTAFPHDQQIQAVDVKMIGNEIIDKYKQKIQQYQKLDEPIQQLAKRTFVRQFYEFEYENFIPKIIIETAQSVIIKDKNAFLSLPETVWNLNRQYQILWTQRLAAEEYIREQYNQHFVVKRQKARNNEYSRFIISHMKQFQQNPTLLWIKHLTLGNQSPAESNLSPNTKQDSSGYKAPQKSQAIKSKQLISKRPRKQQNFRRFLFFVFLYSYEKVLRENACFATCQGFYDKID